MFNIIISYFTWAHREIRVTILILSNLNYSKLIFDVNHSVCDEIDLLFTVLKFLWRVKIETCNSFWAMYCMMTLNFQKILARLIIHLLRVLSCLCSFKFQSKAIASRTADFLMTWALSAEVPKNNKLQRNVYLRIVDKVQTSPR